MKFDFDHFLCIKPSILGFTEEGEFITSWAFSSTKDKIVTASNKGRLSVLSLSDGSILLNPKQVHNEAIHKVAFSSDSKKIIILVIKRVSLNSHSTKTNDASPENKVSFEELFSRKSPLVKIFDSINGEQIKE